MSTWFKADLLASVGDTYDQTRTTIQGRVSQKTIDGQNVLGPPLTNFIDVFTDTGQTPTGSFRLSQNNRLFVLGAPINGSTYDTLPIMLYDFDLATGAHAYVGRIDAQLPNLAATVHTIRGLRVANDAGNTGWKIFIATTSTVLINGGLFVVNNVDKADFIPVAFPTIPMATSSNAKAVYLLQDPANIGINQLNTASVGMVNDTAANRIYVHNGVSATHQYHVFDTAVNPSWASAAVTITAGTPGVITDTGNPYNNNDPVIVTGLTGGTGLTNNQVYFVRNKAVNSYELSLTSGGASITVTLSGTATIGRAWGTSSNNFLFKTGNLPALTGTLLTTDSEEYATPVSSPINGGVLNGNPCVFLGTSTALYLGLVSELTSGTTTWSSLSTSNLLGGTNEITTPTATQAMWSNTLDTATYITNVSKFVVKKLQNNVITANFGELNNSYYEGFTLDTVNLGLVVVSSAQTRNGWLLASGSTAGQRGIIKLDMRSDQAYDFSYVVTKVINNLNSALSFYSTWEKLFDYTGNVKIQYRNSGFGSISSGWIDVPKGANLNTLVMSSNQIQFKILFYVQSEGSSSPAQLNELLFGADANNGISSNWEFSDDWSDNNTPSRCAFRLKLAYSASVPTLYFRAYDLSDALLVNHNTASNPSLFEYSTNNGTSWLPLGTIPNTVGTLVRYTFTSPPGVDIRPGLKES